MQQWAAVHPGGEMVYAIVNANQVAWARPTSEVNRLAKKYALMVNVLERSMLSKQKVRG